MNPLDEYDVRESFCALDKGAEGKLSVSDVYSNIFLGLGYRPDRLTLKSFIAEGKLSSAEELISVETVIRLLRRYTRDREENLEATFQIIDDENKGFLTAKDLQCVSKEVADGSPSLTAFQAQQVIEYFQSKGDDSSLSRAEFRKIFSPPEP